VRAMPTTPNPSDERRGERGAALIIVLLATMLLTGLALSLVMLTSSETLITANYRNGQDSLYAADAAVERVMQDLLTVAQWNDLLRTDNLQSSYTEGPLIVTMPNGQTIDVLKERDRVQYESDRINLWGTNNPQWRVYAWGPLANMLPDGVDSRAFVMVLVADDPSESDSDPQHDVNGVLTLHAEAWSTGGAHRVIEATVARTSTTEIERGYIAQRGQEEWNQRSRKAAVQTPGAALTEMKMNVATGTMVTQ
jgi:hypothetical protein